ncbi:MAG: MgtC/SapB family protein [Turicibacter sp.]|uniref:MgtC/SapB family protein n=1 Tax=unclassified Turicibacter TaxID=2638206 RepID=UPI001379750C|nr:MULTISPECIES: MgtC/SapB family protein [unclassified Turicibacter]MCI8701241.1 MgtC/SapB family protein [Turicibacter sp.]MCI9350635.1 MgtC/SapB family protein [Turicibacter sp.]MCU7203890.1 MgtC/SapB family protein [Turicibacter sp. TA25]MCU7209278.1 MgtC/SapB family protein [Turicibacter sp. 1E2]NCE79235.1 MgtC/SapB family protein [Turicibacter sp. TS3]
MDYQLFTDTILRTLLSMFIGGLIGWERENTHRPAGLRTHMLVSVGACVVMQLGAYNSTHIAAQFNIDPSRLGAQVISGIGFLGAGTIIKEGTTIKGLTTAASLWVVACLGLTIGAGAYILAIVGSLSVLITLTVFEHASSFIPFGKYRRFSIHIKCKELTETLQFLNEISLKYHAKILDLELISVMGDIREISFHLSTKRLNKSLDSTTLFSDMNQNEKIISIKLTEY